MRKLGLLLALLLAPALAAAQERPAQGVVQGTVAAAGTGAPLAAVTVTLRAAADSAAVAARAVTGADGRFRMTGVGPGRYRLQASRLGYATHSAEVSLTPAAPGADLGTITLAASAVALQGVRARAERSTVTVAPDRTIYSTRDMPVAAGGTATDVLRSVPELEVDAQGSVQMRGTAAQIYLNGRPAPMQGQALEVFLQQFPADRIERVEVIPNPSARFEAEGAGGIVNIVLKKNTDLGLSGNVFLNGGTSGELGGGGRLAFQRGPLTLFGGGFLRFSHRETNSYDLRQNLLAQPVTFVEQDAWTDREDWSGNLDLTAELKLGEKSTVFGELGTWRNGFASDGLTAYSILDAAGDPTRRYDRLADSESSRLSLDVTAGFRHLFAEDPSRHEWSVEIERESGGSDDERRVRERILTLAGEDAGLPLELTLDDVDTHETETALRSDYQRPWGEDGQIEVGYRLEMRENDDDRLLRVFPDEGAVDPVSVAERGFVHDETFNSLYLTVSRKLGSLSAQVGLRAERADTRLELPDGQAFDKDYSSLFPSANLTYDLGGGRQARLSYSRRIRRPGPWVLNPVNTSTDPLNRSVGNPDIDAVYSQSLSLETSWTGTAGSLRFSPYYRRTEGEWAQIKTVDAAGVSTVTWENLALVENYGTSLTGSLRPVGGVSGNASVSAYREVRDASNLPLDYSGDALRWSARGNVSAKVTPTLDLQAMAFYHPARDVPQGRISSTLMTHVGLRQRLFNNKASLNVMVTDPFDTFRSSFETRDPTHVQLGRTRQRIRRAVVSFSYSFGQQPRSRDRGGQEEEPQQETIR